MNEKEKKMLLKNLIILMYGNPYVTNVVPPGLTIDIENEQWRWKNPKDVSSFTPTPRKIGQCNHSMRCCSKGVIGVYDKSNIIHLNSMARDWKEINEQDKEP